MPGGAGTNHTCLCAAGSWPMSSSTGTLPAAVEGGNMAGVVKSSDRYFRMSCWNIRPKQGRPMQVLFSRDMEEPTVTIFVGAELVVLRWETARELAELLDQLPGEDDGN